LSDSAISVQPPLGRLPARGSFGGSNAPSYPTPMTVAHLRYSPHLFADSGILLIFPLITRSSYPFQLVTFSEFLPISAYKLKKKSKSPSLI